MIDTAESPSKFLSHGCGDGHLNGLIPFPGKCAPPPVRQALLGAYGGAPLQQLLIFRDWCRL